MRASQQVLRYIIGMQELPLQQFAWLEGLAFRTWLANATGLSTTRIYNGGLEKLRPSTTEQVRQHAQDKGLARALANGWTQADFDARWQRIREVESKGGAAWAAFAVECDRPAEEYLPRTIELALSIDQHLEALREAAASQDLPGYAKLGADFCLAYGDVEAAELEPASWSSATDWAGLELPTARLIEAFWLDLHACLDAEWGGSWAAALQPAPLFTFLMPKVDPALLESPVPWAAFRKRLRRPTRRFLEFAYAITHRKGRRAWPDRAPGAAELAHALSMDPAAVANLFDQTKKLRAAAAEGAWDRLCEHFRVDNKGYPSVMAHVAICWQHLLLRMVNYKLTTVMLLDAKSYESLWQRHRQALPGQATEPEPWPAWISA
jgi:hypothetical protein